jgi:hypothetical protein
MDSENKDPWAHEPKRWVGRQVSFDLPLSDDSTRRATGTVISQKWAGRTKRGAIPDWELTVEGKSGKRLIVSLVESHCSFPNA